MFEQNFTTGFSGFGLHGRFIPLPKNYKSRHLPLPHLILMHEIPGDGLIASMTAFLLDRIKPNNMSAVEVDDPIFEKRCRVYSEYGSLVKAFFTPRRMNWLSGTQDHKAMGRGDGFQFTKFRPEQSQYKSPDEAEWVRDGLIVLKLLENED